MEARTQLEVSLQSAAASLHTALEVVDDLQRAGVPVDVAGIEAAMAAVENAQRTAVQRAADSHDDGGRDAMDPQRDFDHLIDRIRGMGRVLVAEDGTNDQEHDAAYAVFEAAAPFLNECSECDGRDARASGAVCPGCDS